MKIFCATFIIFACAFDIANAQNISASVVAQIPVYRNLTLQNGSDIMNAMDGNIYAFWNSTFGTDIYTCQNYALIVFWNFVDMIKYVAIDPFLSVVTLGLILHKIPLVYRYCFFVYLDISYFDKTIIPLFSSIFTSSAIWSQLIENLMFNLGDILYLMQTAFQYMAIRDYYKFGSMVGYIVSDLLFINPVSTPVWANSNSHIILSDTSSFKVPSSFYQPIVQSKNPQDLIKNIGKTGKNLIESLDISKMKLKRLEKEQRHENIMKISVDFDEKEAQKPIDERIQKLSAQSRREEAKNKALKDQDDAFLELENILQID